MTRNKRLLKKNMRYSEASLEFKTNIGTLTANLQDKLIDNCFTVSGARDGVGATLIACSIAEKESAYKSVLIVDCNFRKPAVGDYFGLQGKGLSEVVLAEAELDEVIQNVGKGLKVITAGDRTAEAIELLISTQFVSLYDRMKSLADIVIFDTPSLDAYKDATVIGKNSGIVLVIDSAERKKYINYAVDSIDLSGAKLLGITINKVDSRRK